MTITVHLTPEEEAQLLAQAQRQQQPPEHIVHSLVHTGLFAVPPSYAPVPDKMHEALVQSLLAAGLMAQQPMLTLGPPPPPIAVQGRPVSQTLLEERQ